MAIPTILQSDSSGEITITLAEGHTYQGATLVVVYNGVSRQYTNLTAGGSVSLAFTAAETAGMPLGTAMVNMRLVGAGGAVETVGNADARIKVTDCVAEVNAGGSFAVTLGGNPLDGVEGLGTRYTGNQLRAKINEVIAKLGGTVAALLLCALPCLGGALDVHTAPFGTVYNDAQVVTNVELDVHALTNGWKFSEPVDLTAASNYTDRTLGAFAGTGTVERARSYGTPTRWTDATGCVWEVATNTYTWKVHPSLLPGEEYMVSGPDLIGENFAWYLIGNMGTELVAYTATPTPTRIEFGPVPGNMIFAELEGVASTNLVGRVALTNDISQAISTNNAAFVAAVLAVPIAGADAGDLAEVAEYGGYGTVGAAILALIAGLAALKRRVTSAETALAQKASLSDLPYRLVTPGEWEFSGVPSGVSVMSMTYAEGSDDWAIDLSNGDHQNAGSGEDALSVIFPASGWMEGIANYDITATRASLPGHLCDRAGNRVVVSDDTTLTLPAANPGYLRDFLVRLEISGSTVPTITFAAPTGETITYETDGDEFPVPDEAGDWLYSFTESCVAHKFAVALKKVNTVAQGGS